MSREPYSIEVTENGFVQSAEKPKGARTSQLFGLWIVLLAATIVGLLIAIFWSPTLVDTVIGMNIAHAVLGRNPTAVVFTNVWFSFVFAIAAGLANTFTACNCVVFSCIAPLSSQQSQRTKRSVGSLLLWMAIGIITVTTLYSVIGTLLNKQIPMLSHAILPFGQEFPVRLLQSSVVFVILGLVLCYWGLVALQFARNPFQKLVERCPWLVSLFLGIIVGFFSVGRPYPLFQELFKYATGSGNVLLSALLLALQGLCNIAVMALVFVLLIYGTGGRFERWLQANPSRSRALTAFSLVVGGIFLIAYWGIRLPSHFGIGWFPTF
jgi:MFS family permease